MSACQAVGWAIDESKRTGSTVTLRRDQMTRMGTDAASACRALFAECGEEYTGGVGEYWGEDVDGNKWRVHVRLDDA